jgi:flagellar hook-length control protein FliK
VTTSDSSVVSAALASPDVVAQITQLDTDIQAVLAALPQETQDAVAAKIASKEEQSTLATAASAATTTTATATTDSTTDTTATADTTLTTDSTTTVLTSYAASGAVTTNAQAPVNAGNSLPVTDAQSIASSLTPLVTQTIATKAKTTTTVTANAAATALAAKETQASTTLAEDTEPETAPTKTPQAPFVTSSLILANASETTDDTSNALIEPDALSGGNKSFSGTTPGSSASAAAEGSAATGTYSFTSTLSAFRATNGGAVGLPSVVDQVVLQMNRNVKNGQSQMSLQLQPSDLGKISVKLTMSSDGKVQGTVVADNPKTLDMLQKDSRSLERALQDAGLRADPGSLQFSLGGQKDSNNAGQAAGNGNASSGEASSDGTISAEDSDDTDLAAIGAMAETYYITPTGVNIRV